VAGRSSQLLQGVEPGYRFLIFGALRGWSWSILFPHGITGAFNRLMPHSALAHVAPRQRPDIVKRRFHDAARGLRRLEAFRRFGLPSTAVSFGVPAATSKRSSGRNGGGKSTCFNLISGYYPASSGKLTFAGQDITHLPMHADRAARNRPHVPDDLSLLAADRPRQCDRRLPHAHKEQFVRRADAIAARTARGTREPRTRL